MSEKKKTEIGRWDTAELLENQEEIDLYLQVAFGSGDPTQIVKALDNAARAQEMLNIARKNFPIKLSENRNPTLITLTTVIDKLGYQLSIMPKNHNSHKLRV